jgi:TRAP-type uncharacterized transport system fused permease subunit
MITLSPQGTSLLMIGDPATIAWTFSTACLAVAALAFSFGGYFLKPANGVERVLAGLGGLALLYADPRVDAIGMTMLAIAAALHVLRVRRATTPVRA